MEKQYFVVFFTFAVSLVVVKEVEGSIETRNSIRRYLAECEANNIIDQCWRCKPDWADNRQALGQCACGFAKGTTGGSGGEIYTVTDGSDDDAANPKPGTLRFGVIQDRPLWIIFSGNMVITLKHELVLTKDKTIDGRGFKIEIANGGGFSVHNIGNVIIHGIHFHNIKVMEGGLIKVNEGKPQPRHKSDGDAICVFGSSKVWIDHCTFSNHGPDGLIDVIFGSTCVTISNCLFKDHDKVMLLGADDKHDMDKNMQVTIAFNRFALGCVQRMPRCRFGLFQVVNNDYEKWGEYAIGGSANPTILSQGNRFVASDHPHKKNVLVRAGAPPEEWKKWNWRSEKDILENGAKFEVSGSDPQLTPEQQALMIPAEPGDAVLRLTNCAGTLCCTPGQPC